MNAFYLNKMLRRITDHGLNLPTMHALVAVSIMPRDKEGLKLATGNNHAWKCVKSSVLFDIIDDIAHLSEKGEETLNRITK